VSVIKNLEVLVGFFFSYFFSSRFVCSAYHCVLKKFGLCFFLLEGLHNKSEFGYYINLGEVHLLQESLVPRLGGPQSRSGRGGEEKNFQPLPGLEPRIDINNLLKIHTHS
jgi:hypothetical protein